MRDLQLDIYRGLVMIYIVCFIHVVSWLHIGEEPYFSMMLFEMPVIFFIAGASQSIGRGNKSFLQIVWNRIKRVVLPFYIYAAVSLIVILLLTLLWRNFYPQILITFGENIANKYSYDIFSYTWNDVLSIILCQNIPQAPIMWHVWFIVPYFLISCFFYPQKWIINKIGWGGQFAICIFLCIVTWVFQGMAFCRLFAVYNLFYMVGYLFYKKLGVVKLVLAGFVSFVMLLWMVINPSIYVIPMQQHKVLTDYVFVVYGLFALSMLALIFRKMKLKTNAIFDLWNKRGYTIYLYQNMVYFVFFPVFLKWISKWDSAIIQMVACSCCIFALSSLLSYITYRLEQKIMSFL